MTNHFVIRFKDEAKLAYLNFLIYKSKGASVIEVISESGKKIEVKVRSLNFIFKTTPYREGELFKDLLRRFSEEYKARKRRSSFVVVKGGKDL